jgi:transcription antitermination factor NusA-like protein
MACKKKLDEGEITESEIRVSRAVKALAKTFKTLETVSIIRVIEGKNAVVILCGNGDRSKMIGREGMIINRLSKAIGKTARVVEETGDEKEFVQSLIYPVPLLGMNIVYSGGDELLKIIIPRGRSIPLPKASLDEIVRLVFGKGAAVTGA